MNETETRAFLESRGLRQIELGEWQPGEPVLYVIEERLKGDEGPFQDLSQSKRPSLGRIDSPTNVVRAYPKMEPDGSWSVIYGIANEEGSPIDYYAIDAVSGIPQFVRSANNPVRFAEQPYYADRKNVFVKDDELFPKA